MSSKEFVSLMDYTEKVSLMRPPQEKEDPKTFSLTLTAEQRKYLSYTAVALLGYFLARHLVKSAVKSLKDSDD